MAGFLAPGSSYWSRLPGEIQWHNATVIACYSCGTAKEFNLLPFYLCLAGHSTKSLFETIVA
jgi:hypothetical protein